MKLGDKLDRNLSSGVKHSEGESKSGEGHDEDWADNTFAQDVNSSCVKELHGTGNDGLTVMYQ